MFGKAKVQYATAVVERQVKQSVEVLVEATLFRFGKLLDLSLPIAIALARADATRGQPRLLFVLPLLENSSWERVSEPKGDEIGCARLPPMRQITLIDADGPVLVEWGKAWAKHGSSRVERN